MNKRIKELAEQCYRTSGVLGSDSWQVHTTFDEQKFAELIIQECMGICDKTEDGYLADEDLPHNEKFAIGAGVCCNEIHRRFGVKEEISEDKIKALTSAALENCKDKKVKTVMPYPIKGYGIAEIPTSFTRELVKLVVKECIDQIEEVKELKRLCDNADPVYEEGMNDGMFVAIRTIEEHFELK